MTRITHVAEDGGFLPVFPIVEGIMLVPGIGVCEVEPMYIASIFAGYRFIPLDDAGYRGEPSYMEIRR